MSKSPQKPQVGHPAPQAGSRPIGPARDDFGAWFAAQADRLPKDFELAL
jgi:hypothetical protein